VAWWRRRAYNLTIASTASRSESAQPDFLKVDEKARAAAVGRGEDHEEFLDAREKAEAEAAAAAAALAASKGPLTLAQRLAKISAFLMSLFTLVTVIFGAVGNVGRMGASLESVGSVEKMKMILADNWFGGLVAIFVIGWHVYKYFTDKGWTKEV
jgi:hypothetical protein